MPRLSEPVATFTRYRVIEVDVQAQQTPRLIIARGELTEVRCAADIAFADKQGAPAGS
jgi:hypothetical protein